jgi:hypothetical protein
MVQQPCYWQKNIEKGGDAMASIPWAEIIYFILKLLFEGCGKDGAVSAAADRYSGIVSESDIWNRLGW